MMMRWPQNIAPGTRIDQPVAHIDVMPTIAAAADAPLPDGRVIDGVDVLPLMNLDVQATWPRKTLFWQNGHYQVVRHEDWKLQVNDRPTDGLKYWLYNLAEDPTEQNNLATQLPNKTNQLLGLLAEHQADSVEPLYPSASQFPIMVDKTMAESFRDGDEYVYTPN
jgi:uncharacterized sulfatase